MTSRKTPPGDVPKPDRKPRPRQGLALLPGVGVALFSFALYLSTLAPTVLYYEEPAMYDPAMLQAEVRVLGIGHPSGYPTYMMLTHPFTYLPFGDVAYRVNLASTVYAAAAVFVVYLIGLRLTRVPVDHRRARSEPGPQAFPDSRLPISDSRTRDVTNPSPGFGNSRRIVAAAIGALAFAVSWTFWSQAVIAEVYTLNALFVALVVLTLLVWREERRDRYLLLAAFLMGLALTHHLTSGLLLPAGLLFVFLVERRKLRDRRIVLKGAALFVLGLLPYLYLPIRALMDAPLNEADPSSPGRFLLLVTASSYLLKLLTDVEPPAGTSDPWREELLARLSTTVEQLSGQFPVLLVPIGALGLYFLARTDRAAALFTGLLASGWFLHAVTDGIKDFYVFIIPAYMMFSAWISVGTGVALRWIEDAAGRSTVVPRKVLPAGFAAILLAATVLGAWWTYGKVDRSEDLGGREAIEAVAEDVAPGATVLHHRSQLWYMVLVEGRRRDLTLVDPFNTSWNRFNDIVWPDPLNRAEADARYDLDDTTGVAAAKEAAKNGPVYVLDPNSLNPDKAGLRFFEEAGFEAVRVDGELYELVPPGRAPR